VDVEEEREWVVELEVVELEVVEQQVQVEVD